VSWLLNAMSDPMLKTADRIDWLRSQGYPQAILYEAKRIYPASDPEMKYFVWVAKLLKEKGLPYEEGRDGLTARLQEIIDWAQHAKPSNLMSMDFWQARQAAFKWHQDSLKWNPAELVEQYQSKKVFDLPGNWWIAELTPQDCSVEGKLMGHCLSKSRDYDTRVAKGISRMFSLRDPEGFPHVTVELTRDETGDWRVEHGEGKQAQEPIPKYRQLVDAWLKAWNIPVPGKLFRPDQGVE